MWSKAGRDATARASINRFVQLETPPKHFGAHETMRKTAVAILVLGALVGSSREAAAQWTDRGYINFSIGVESGSSDLNDTKNYILYDEPATTNTASSITSGNIIDFGAGVRIWRNVSVGGGLPSGKQQGGCRDHRYGAEPNFLQSPAATECDGDGVAGARRWRATSSLAGWCRSAPSWMCWPLAAPRGSVSSKKS